MLTLLQRPLVRLLMVGLVVLTIQTTLLSELRPFGVVLDLMLALSLASGIVAGPERGALAGFTLGLLFDFVLITPFGLSALAYGLGAFAVGFVKESITIEQTWWLTMVLMFGGTAFAKGAFAVLATLVGREGLVNVRLVEQVIVIGVVNALLGPLLVHIQRWTLVVEREV